MQLMPGQVLISSGSEIQFRNSQTELATWTIRTIKGDEITLDTKDRSGSEAHTRTVMVGVKFYDAQIQCRIDRVEGDKLAIRFVLPPGRYASIGDEQIQSLALLE